MLLMVEKVLQEEYITLSMDIYVKANNKYMKDYNENKESQYLQYWDITNLYGWAMSQKLPEINFECIKDTSQFKDYMTFTIIYNFYLKK